MEPTMASIGETQPPEVGAGPGLAGGPLTAALVEGGLFLLLLAMAAVAGRRMQPPALSPDPLGRSSRTRSKRGH